MDERDVLAACGRYRLEREPPRARGELGGSVGLRVGSSVDYLDQRHYQPGDDPRRIDWARYARSDQLSVRLYREEVHPWVDVLLDGSRSMAIGDGRKLELSQELAAFVWHSARLQGSAARLYVAGETLVPCEQPARVVQDGRVCALFADPHACARRLRAGALRILISDCLTQLPPRAALAELARGASALWVLMTLGPFEAEPRPAGALSLIEAESEQELSLELDAAAIQRYRARLSRLRGELRHACEGLGAQLLEVVCDASLADVLRRDLLRAGLVRPV